VRSGAAGDAQRRGVLELAEASATASVSLAWRATGASRLAHTFIDLAIRARDQGELAALTEVV
jgi:hypothetical protein